MKPLRKVIKSFATTTRIGSFLFAPYRFKIAARYLAPPLWRALFWSFQSRELSNFTYDLTSYNKEYLAHTVANVTGECCDCVRGYIGEIENDAPLRSHIRTDVGRRLGWYAFARSMKPKVIVETGVHAGIGAVVLCSALLRNSKDGYSGRYYGTDINPQAGSLLTDPYNSVGSMLYGDSLQSLRSIQNIDLFINDSDHSADYERQEYELIASKISPEAVILGDNAHCTPELAKFSEKHGRRFLFFKEEPANHWYPGGGIGISY
jgi:predicted O-methyltransferase YrrM